MMKTSKEKIDALRELMKSSGVSCFVVPKNDEFGGEYVPEHDDRLAWLTGFTGSAGISIITDQGAFLWVDGRYTLQAQKQVDTGVFTILPFKKPDVGDDVSSTLNGVGPVMAYDPKLHFYSNIQKWVTFLKDKNIEARPVDNFIDLLWHDRPVKKESEVFKYPELYHGEFYQDKAKRIASQIKGDAFFITDPHNIAWLLNVRANDLPCTPIALSYAILYKNGNIEWFIDPERVPERVRSCFKEDVIITPLENLKARLEKTKYIGVDPDTSSCWAVSLISIPLFQPDPITLQKARKNIAEQGWARKTHVTDGVALCKFLAWIDQHQGECDELIVVEKLEEFRRFNANYKGPSFPTISGFGPNGAIVHYHSVPETNLPFKGNNLYLCDSGGQYLGGTTDVTRTIYIGDPDGIDPDYKKYYTAVLKGHIALASAQFLIKTSGSQLDTLARQYLWKIGADYSHGTGHGVGNFLSVHEGPHHISTRSNDIPLDVGMIMSNEPGFYWENHFGIRLESLIMVIRSPQHDNTLCFETLTMAPFDSKLIDMDEMVQSEIEWLNTYHQTVWKNISPHLDHDEQKWLKKATEPLEKN